MKILFGPVAICSCLLIATACHKSDDNHNNNNTLSKTDQEFMVKAAYANLNEVDAGSLAAMQGSDSSVKAFGQHMVTEHGQAYNELKSIADSYNDSTLPTAPDAQHQLIKDTLMTLTGHAFDSAYINSQVKDHQVAVALFQSEADNGTGKLKDYAIKYLPHVQEHLAKADSILSNF